MPPRWLGPGDDVAGGPVYAQPVILRRDDLRVVARDVVVYPFALGFALDLVFAGGARWPGGPWDGPPDAPGALRACVVWADGTRVDEAPGAPQQEGRRPARRRRGVGAGLLAVAGTPARGGPARRRVARPGDRHVHGRGDGPPDGGRPPPDHRPLTGAGATVMR